MYVGRICTCFTHELCNETRKFALIDIYASPKLDSESHLWWVSMDEETQQYTFEISSL